MKTLPVLQTERLLLRQMTANDLVDLIQNINHEEIADNLFNIPFPYGEQDAIQRFQTVLTGFEKQNRFIFGITIQGENKLIGELGLSLDEQKHKAEMGYWLTKRHWGKGYMSEVVAAALKFAFETLKLHKVFATHFLDNPASGKILAKHGMIKEAEMKDHYFFNGRVRSHAQYRLTKEEYKAL